MIDANLRPIFHDKLRRGFHWQAVETGGTGLGIPDSNYCGLREDGTGAHSWVEFKQTEAWAVGLSPEQVSWHKVRAMRGGRSFVAVRRWHDGGPRKGDAVDELWLFEGRVAQELKDGGLQCGVGLLGCWQDGPSRWDWDQVRELLLA